jgi:hypothetical protein
MEQEESLDRLPVTMVDDSNWEPDGVTLQVRFCEGGSAYQETEIAAATLLTPEILESVVDLLLHKPVAIRDAVAIPLLG